MSDILLILYYVVCTYFEKVIAQYLIFMLIFITATVERLNEEFYKVLKSCDAHSNEYVDRLKDEDRVMSILETAQGILEKSKTPSEMCRIYLQRVDHIYFKFDQNVIKQRNVSGFFLLKVFLDFIKDFPHPY